MKKVNNKLVYLAAIAYALIIGLSSLFTKLSLDVAEPIDILAHRFTVSFAAVSIPVLFKWVKVDYNRARIKKIIPLAIVYPMLYFGFQTFGLQYASSSEAGMLLATAPVFTLILATYFLKEKSTSLQKVSVILSVAGVIYISIMKGSSLDINNIKGIILLVLSALCMAVYSIMAKKLTEEFTAMELSFIIIFLSFLPDILSCSGVGSIIMNSCSLEIKTYPKPSFSSNQVTFFKHLFIVFTGFIHCWPN